MPVAKKSSMWSARRSSDAMTPRTPATGGGYPEAEAKQEEEQIISLGAKAGDKVPVVPPLLPPPAPTKAVDEGVVSLGRPRPPRQPTAAAPSAEGEGEQMPSLSKVMPIQLPQVPICFLCPISQQVMKDPVTAADGVTYERARIEALLRSGRRESPATGQPLESTDVCANAELRYAIEGYLGLRREAERQWAELEVNIAGYMAQVGRKLEQNDQQVRELQKQLQSLEGNGRTKATPRSSAASTAASPSPPEVHGEPPMLPLRAEEERPPAECPFSAGPAPRSARGTRPPIPSPVNRAGSGTPAGTPAGQTSSSPFFGLKTALTPRLSQLVRTPRGRSSSQTPR